MVMIATLVFLVSLSLLLLLAAASYISRGAVRRGAIIIVLAAGLIGTSAFSIYPALRLTSGSTEEVFLVAELATLRAERDQLLADVNQRARDGEALAKTSAFFSKLHKERLTRISDELRTIKDLASGPDSGLVLAPEGEVSLTSFLDGPSGFDSILADLKRLKSLRARTPADPVAPTLAMLGPSHKVEGDKADAGTTGMIVDAAAQSKPVEVASAVVAAATEPDTLGTLRKALDVQMTTTSYKVGALAEPELIAGRKGRYYLVELKNPKNGDRFTFDSGKYTFQNSRAAYKASFNSFAADILKQLESKAKFDLFVRGSADGQAYQGALEPGFEFRKVTYLPSSRGLYLANAATVPVASIVHNADLPNLRGEYLRGFLSELYPAKPATLLEGQVTKKDNPAARNTELILFVDWAGAAAGEARSSSLR
jgi:hypothetical protein